MEEEKINETVQETAETEKSKVDEIIDKLKTLVKEGNVTHIRVRKGDTIVLNIPMTAGVLGTILGAVTAPWAMIIATIATIGLKCTVEVEKKDGQITIVHGKEEKE
ncbi:MAG: DUF4342 domain-containing protein [Clostridia bacterium]|nr:DUF4342 domain-containing protein [Clostridia bacterium]